MLLFQANMLVDLLQEDGLIIAAKGLGLEKMFTRLIKIYCKPENLVLVLGTSHKDNEFFIRELDAENVKPLPKIVSELRAAEREKLYKEGGVLFVSSPTFVVDILKGRVPLTLVTGILLYRAHHILESYLEAFAIWLYRQKNKRGFVKACSSSPQCFTVRFARIDPIMNILCVERIYLWPNFHWTVVRSLLKNTPAVEDVQIEMTTSMLLIQTAVLDLLNFTVEELKRCNPTLDTDKLSVENLLTKSFHKILQLQLDPIWHQLSLKTKQLVADLKTLNSVLGYLTKCDCVTFYLRVQSLKSAEYAMESSRWVTLDAAETLFVHAHNRIFGSTKHTQTLHIDVADNKDGDNDESEIEPNLECNPKWQAFSNLLLNIQDKIGKHKPKSNLVLVFAENASVCKQLMDVLTLGSNTVLRQLYEKVVLNKMEPKMKIGSKAQDNNDENSSMTLALSQLVKNPDEKVDKITPKITRNKEFGTFDGDGTEIKFIRSPGILIQPLKSDNPYHLMQCLKENQPSHVVMYDTDMVAVRQLEVYSRLYPEVNLHTYFITYKGSVEDRAYDSTFRLEREAFFHLIKEKQSRLIPENRDVRTDGHGGAQSEDSAKQMIIVDLREFCNELPSLIHHRGIDLEPVTLQIGNYILTLEICVERKSISDLIGSLNSGRLYNQAQSMTRYYAKPMLFIEFDQYKPFALQGHYYVSNDISSNDVAARLQLLTMHFPKLHIVWSPSPYATAELFEELKQGREQPDCIKAAALGAETPMYEKYNSNIQEFVSNLPGINTDNVEELLNRVESLDDLLSYSKEALVELLGNSLNGSALWDAVHKPLKPQETVPVDQPNKIERKRSLRGIESHTKMELLHRIMTSIYYLELLHHTL